MVSSLGGNECFCVLCSLGYDLKPSLLLKWVYKLILIRTLCFPPSTSSCNSLQNFLPDFRRQCSDTALGPQRWSYLRKFKEVNPRGRCQFLCIVLWTHPFFPPHLSHLCVASTSISLLGYHSEALQNGRFGYQKVIFLQFEIKQSASRLVSSDGHKGRFCSR